MAVALALMPALMLATVAFAQTVKPLPAPAQWRPLIGEYVRDSGTIVVFEDKGKLWALFKDGKLVELRELDANVFAFAGSRLWAERAVFSRDPRGKVTQLKIGDLVYKRRPLGPEEGATQLKVEPLRPVPDLIKEALAAQPPQETGDFLPSDLVELTKLDPTIKLDIRYATTNNLFGTVFYSQPRAFLQRAAAEAS